MQVAADRDTQLHALADLAFACNVGADYDLAEPLQIGDATFALVRVEREMKSQTRPRLLLLAGADGSFQKRFLLKREDMSAEIAMMHFLCRFNREWENHNVHLNGVAIRVQTYEILAIGTEA
ncbi:unnamed protein product [Polarella glacialis]|uniref:Uncharacterized protein n=1 Tax=Polarella glacialis TaxID=89957 RepID=A0A813I2N1_POLGL|nr:unnamed protein product [Polarella glacialis]